jgi:tripartite-type tricarboxylate transporter receptor subunit TctC
MNELSFLSFLVLMSTGVLGQEPLADEADPLAGAVRAGRPADVVARILAAGLASAPASRTWSRTSRARRETSRTPRASKSAPTATRVLFVVPSVITNPFYLKASIDPFRDLAPVIHLDIASMVLIAHPAFPRRPRPDVLAFIKANPGKVSCGASGRAALGGCELLRAHAGADVLMVMYKGNGRR